jgi:hypothetical protein
VFQEPLGAQIATSAFLISDRIVTGEIVSATSRRTRWPTREECAGMFAVAGDAGADGQIGAAIDQQLGDFGIRASEVGWLDDPFR